MKVDVREILARLPLTRDLFAVAGLNCSYNSLYLPSVNRYFFSYKYWAPVNMNVQAGFIEHTLLPLIQASGT